MYRKGPKKCRTGGNFRRTAIFFDERSFSLPFYFLARWNSPLSKSKNILALPGYISPLIVKDTKHDTDKMYRHYRTDFNRKPFYAAKPGTGCAAVPAAITGGVWRLEQHNNNRLFCSRKPGCRCTGQDLQKRRAAIVY